jgi:hypothetical protein
MSEQVFEVKLADGRTVEWPGVDGPTACARAADCLGVAAIAWRYPRVEFIPGVHHSQIIG